MMFVQRQYRIQGSTASGIAASIESGVRDGGLAPGAALPTVRGLADELGVAANTVAAAYRALRQRGVIETDGRRGTRIRPRPPAQPRVLALPIPRGARDLSGGGPNVDLLPAFGPALRHLDPPRTSYDTAGPYEPLIALGRERLAADGVPAGSVTVTGGALDGIERSLLAWTSPGDRVAVEDPGWSNLLDLVAALGLDPVPVAVDDDGPDPSDLARALRHGAKATIVTSRAHNPTGAAVSKPRADALRDVLAAHPDTLVIEDDHAAELAGVPLHTLRWSDEPLGDDPVGEQAVRSRPAPCPAGGRRDHGQPDRRAAAARHGLGQPRPAEPGGRAVVVAGGGCRGAARGRAVRRSA